MNSKHMMTMACAVALCGSVLADNKDTATDETPFVSTEVALGFDSKFMSYGLVDNNNPIVTPSAAIKIFDTATIGVSSILDTSRYGRAAGYGNRAWRYQEFDPSVCLSHLVTPEEVAWLPTCILFDLGYMYEYHPQAMGHGKGEPGEDTHFATLSTGLPDFWLEPTLVYERDLDRDHGTYLNLELGHTFTLIAAAAEGGDILTFRLSAAQGWGDKKRLRAYLPDVHKAGLMDTCIKGELTWHITDGVSLGGYVAYYDYLFGSTTRAAVRHYEATGHWNESWNFVTGLALTVAF